MTQPVPVSYTHLKSNKQSGLATLKAKQDEAKKAEAKARLEAEKKTVSYTHLMEGISKVSSIGFPVY